MVAFLTADKHLPLIKRSVIPRALFDDPASTGTVLAATGQTTPESNVMDFTGDNLAPTDDTEIPDDSNVQGDIYVIFPKGAEDFIFFTMTDVAKSKTFFKSFRPTSARETIDNLKRIYDAKEKGTTTNDNTLTIVQTQIAFSRAGLNFLGIKENVEDSHFDKGSMLLDRTLLSDQREWDPIFAKGSIHGVIMVAANKKTTGEAKYKELKTQMETQGITCEIMSGKVRSGDNKGHEHFGFLDGVSQPALRGIAKPCPGQLQADVGVIVMGYKGDPNIDNTNLSKRPSWTKDGSLMVFRRLEQDVPEFHKYTKDIGPKWREFIPKDYKSPDPNLTDKEGTALFKAQMLGRWTSGAPLALAPIRDDPELGKDRHRRNNFDYSVKKVSGPSSSICPFTAHSRKMAPRNLDPYVQRKFLESAMIIRTGIPYGNEVTSTEIAKGKTGDKKRGLLFICYQSSLENGFVLLTTAFADNDYFPTTSFTPQRHGQDPILGSPPAEIQGAADNIDVIARGRVPNPPFVAGVEQQFFVTSRGGEYFFVPSISTLKAWSG